MLTKSVVTQEKEKCGIQEIEFNFEPKNYKVCDGFRLSELLIFESILISFKPSIIFGGSQCSAEK